MRKPYLHTHFASQITGRHNYIPMKFDSFAYQRPDVQKTTETFQQHLSAFQSASNFDEATQAFEAINQLRTAVSTQWNICHIRHTIDTRDAFYADENTFFDQATPQFQGLDNQFYKALLKSPFRNELEDKWGAQLFKLAETSLATFKDGIQEALQKENSLASAYMKLKAGAQIPFRGKTYNLSNIQPLELDPDRNTRKEASIAKWNFFDQKQQDIHDIFDQLIQTRHNIAQKLGFDNFIGLAYARLSRTDYDHRDVAKVREAIVKYVVPVTNHLYAQQRERLQLDQLSFYDESFRFTSGNPKPAGDATWIMKQAKKMYSELSPETDTFFNHMEANGLMDLVAKDGKATGGYCTYISDYESPFIFSNFNGTSADIDVLTHEAGHAFQVYSSRHWKIKEYQWPTMEACEIHSMSMEFLTWPWMHLFFEDDTPRQLFAHLSGAVMFLPYGAAIDEFQHWIYENPEAKPEERSQQWRKLEQKYLPHRNYEGYELLENGNFWMRQSHVFSVPFYYIDYVLAQFGAFQFWLRSRRNDPDAWTDYLRLCKAGGSQSFTELLKTGNLKSPFDENNIREIMSGVADWLEQSDTANF